ncbi:MAG: hypothetical protein AAFX99_18855, partial [Myxococcota bacterium]
MSVPSPVAGHAHGLKSIGLSRARSEGADTPQHKRSSDITTITTPTPGPPRMMRQPRTGLAVLTLLGLIVSCGGSTQVNDPPIPSYPGHLAYIGADAEVVLSVNNLAERGRTIARSKAYAQFKQFLARVFEEDSGPVRDLAVDPDGTLDTYAELFAGRMTLVSYPTADSKAASPSGDEEENFVILTDADPRALIEAVESVDDTQGSFEEVGRGMMRYTSADPDSEP